MCARENEGAINGTYLIPSDGEGGGSCLEGGGGDMTVTSSKSIPGLETTFACTQRLRILYDVPKKSERQECEHCASQVLNCTRGGNSQ